MIKEELSEILNNREIRNEITDDEIDIAKENNLVVVFPYSDDGIIFIGSIRDHFSAWRGGIYTFSKTGLFHFINEYSDFEDIELKILKKHRIENPYINNIKAVWNDKGNPCWYYETTIPHSKFNIMEEGELFAIGIIFSMNDLV